MCVLTNPLKYWSGKKICPWYKNLAKKKMRPQEFSKELGNMSWRRFSARDLTFKFVTATEKKWSQDVEIAIFKTVCS